MHKIPFIGGSLHGTILEVEKIPSHFVNEISESESYCLLSKQIKNDIWYYYMITSIVFFKKQNSEIKEPKIPGQNINKKGK